MDRSKVDNPPRGRPPKGWRVKFLAALSKTANICEACELAVVSRTMAYRVRSRDPKFAAKWDVALETAYDRIEREAYRRAVEGYDEPVFYQGDECGLIRRYSDTLMQTLLKANRPEKFRDGFEAAKKVAELLTQAQRFMIPIDDDRPEPNAKSGLPAEEGS